MAMPRRHATHLLRWIPALAMAAAVAGFQPHAALGGQPEAFAHAPMYENKELWPALTGKEAYVTQKWPKARLLVWAGGKGNFRDASKWLEDGKPATAPPNRNTDVVFPDANQPYKVNAGLANCRHITVGRNAELGVGKRYFSVYGNLWVRKGGHVEGANPKGDRHTFFRHDFPAKDLPAASFEKRTAMPNFIHDKMVVSKYGDASVEFLGGMGVKDEIYVATGTMVLGPGCEFRLNCATGNGTMEVFSGATLELQSGSALVNHWKTAALSNIAFHEGATLRIGSKLRPLTSDAVIRVDPIRVYGEPSMFLLKGSKFEMHTADPEKARLVIESNEPGKKITPDKPRQAGISIGFGGGQVLRAVHFDQIAPAGIELAKPEMRNQWSNITFGPHCSAAGDALYGKLQRSGLDLRKNARSVKYKLFVDKSNKEMKEFEKSSSREEGPDGDK